MVPLVPKFPTAKFKFGSHENKNNFTSHSQPAANTSQINWRFCSSQLQFHDCFAPAESWGLDSKPGNVNNRRGPITCDPIVTRMWQVARCDNDKIQKSMIKMKPFNSFNASRGCEFFLVMLKKIFSENSGNAAVQVPEILGEQGILRWFSWSWNRMTTSQGCFHPFLMELCLPWSCQAYEETLMQYHGWVRAL